MVKLNRNLPYIIDDQEFADECPHYDKLSLYYYRIDDVLCGDGEEIIDNVDDIIGLDALQSLDMQTTIWVRNESLSIDYEIISINKSYADVVQGFNNLSPREKHEKKMRRESNEK